MILKLSNSKLFEFTFILWGVTTVLPILSFAVYILPALAMFWFFSERKEFHLKSVRQGIVFYALLLFVVWELLSLTYTQNIGFGLTRVEKRIPLVIIGLFGILKHPRKQFSNQAVLLSYIIGLALGLFIVAFHTLYAYLFGNLKANILVCGLGQVNYLEGLKHYTYAGIELLMGIAAILALKAEEKGRTYLINLLIVVFLFVLIYLSGAKIVILAGGLVGFLLLVKWLSKKYSTTIVVIVGLSMIVIFSGLVFVQPRFQKMASDFAQHQRLENINPRYQTWDSSLKIIRENYVLGVGMGDYQDELMARYEKDGYTYALRNNFNIHNQFLQTATESGIVGLFLLLMIFASIFWYGKRSVLSVAFVGVYLTCFLTESCLLRNMGVMTFAFWILFLGENPTNESALNVKQIKLLDYAKYVSLFAIALFVLVLIFGAFSRFDPKDPRTYFSSINTSFHTETVALENQEVNAVVVDEKISFAKDRIVDFIAVPFYRDMCSVNASGNFSLWCYVSDNSNVSKVYIYAYNYIDQSTKAYADILKRGEWQKIVMADYNMKGAYELGVRIDRKPDSPSEGIVKLAYPQYEIK